MPPHSLRRQIDDNGYATPINAVRAFFGEPELTAKPGVGEPVVPRTGASRRLEPPIGLLLTRRLDPPQRKGTATLLTSGRHDQATPEPGAGRARRHTGVRWVVLEDSAHMTHAEETKSYLGGMDDFLTRAEASP